MTRHKRIGGALAGAALVVFVAWLYASGGKTHQVVIEEFAFVPARLAIARGDTVEFLNKDIVPHTATADAGLWDTGHLAKGRSHSVDFDTAGVLAYSCAFHPHMRAEIVVVGN